MKKLSSVEIMADGFRLVLIPAKAEVRYLPDAGHGGGDVFVTPALTPADADGWLVKNTAGRALMFVQRWSSGWYAQIVRERTDPNTYRVSSSLLPGSSRKDAIERSLHFAMKQTANQVRGRRRNRAGWQPAGGYAHRGETDPRAKDPAAQERLRAALARAKEAYMSGGDDYARESLHRAMDYGRYALDFGDAWSQQTAIQRIEVALASNGSGGRRRNRAGDPVASLVSMLRSNADAYHAGRVSHTAFSKRNASIWSRIHAMGRDAHERALAQLRAS